MKKEKSRLLFLAAGFFSMVFLAIPLLLKIPFINGLAYIFLESLGNYKSSYFEACGAMIGTFFAVASAIRIQQKSEEEQSTIDDIYWFYGEVTNLKNKLEQINDYSLADINTIRRHLYNIGPKMGIIRKIKECQMF